MGKDFAGEARDDAASMAEEFVDEILENILSTQGTSLHYADYTDGDEYHHSTHVDRSYSLTEAAEIIESASYYFVENDSGLWQGLEPIEAVKSQAAYTYGNMVVDYFQQLIKEINGDNVLDDLLNPEPREGGCTPTRDGEENVDEKAVKERILEIISEFRP